MITDHIRNRQKYYFLGEDFKAALDFFANVTDAPFEKSDIPVENSGAVIKMRPMNTKEVKDCKFEAHRKYADIHFVAYGKEKIGYCDITKLSRGEYDSDGDIEFLAGPEGDYITLLPGYFLIALPDDAHMPCVCVDTPAPFGKMIAKVKL